MTEQNPWSLCHLFLLRHCDGNHAERFIQSWHNTPYDLTSPIFTETLAQLSYEAQITVLVDYWITQMTVVCNLPCTPQVRNRAISQAIENFDLWLLSLQPLIEINNLPQLP